MTHDVINGSTSVQDIPMRTPDPRDPGWAELTRQAQLMLGHPWEASRKALVQAVVSIQTGKVALGIPATRLAYVTSSDGQRVYLVQEHGCNCRATHHCYHQDAAELYRLWQGKLALLHPEERA